MTEVTVERLRATARKVLNAPSSATALDRDELACGLIGMTEDARRVLAERDRLRELLDNATKIGAYLAGLDCNSPAEERLAEIRKEAGLDA